MITWEDNAITLAKQRYGENNYLLTLFTASRGKYGGFTGAYSRAHRRSLESGQFVKATWKSRLPEQVGTWQLDLMKPLPWLVLDSPTLLNATNTATNLAYDNLPEREPQPELFEHLSQLLTNFNSPHWPRYYLAYEQALLSACGYGLSLQHCGVTKQKHDLIYISPKTGSAISKECGEPYKEKLFTWLALLADPLNLEHSLEELEEASRISSWFVSKFLYDPRGKTVPTTRVKLHQDFINYASSLKLTTS